MRIWVTGLFTIAIFAFAGTAISANQAQADLFPSFTKQGSNTPGSFADLAEQLLPAVVNISSTQKMGEAERYIQPPEMEMPEMPHGSPFEDFFEDFFNNRGVPMPSVPPASLGSGFVVDAENGYIVTNNHVVRDADDVRVTFHDDETLEAEVIGRDEKTDLAVLKVDTDKKLQQVSFGDSDKLRVGDWVLAIGNPFGLGGTVTAGIISARQRDINSGPYDDYLQTDASINRGNSGGPMFNLQGQVIGINTAIYSPSGGSVGIGFAIPSSLAKPLIDQIIEYGRTRRGWLGVRIQSVTEEIAESLGLGSATGALVAGVTEGGPAEKAGLQAGDIILEFNGQPVDEMRLLPRIVAETPIGSNVTVTYWRNNRRHKVGVEIGELEKAEDEGLIETTSPYPEEGKDTGKPVEGTGLTLGKITETMRDKYGISNDVQGVVITSVKRGSDAERKGLIEGDVIMEVNQTPVESADQVLEIIQSAKAQGRNSILFLVNQDGDVRFTALKVEEPKDPKGTKGKSE